MTDVALAGSLRDCAGAGHGAQDGIGLRLRGALGGQPRKEHLAQVRAESQAGVERFLLVPSLHGVVRLA